MRFNARIIAREIGTYASIIRDRCMVKWRLSFAFVLLAAFTGLRASAATIDVMYVDSIGIEDYYATDPRILAIGSADYYVLSDGTTWRSGAGSTTYSYMRISKVETAGTTLRLTMAAPLSGRMYRQTDYNGGNHSAQGTLAAVGPLVIQAELGSKTAYMSGYLQILENDETWYGQPRFNYYSAQVGEIVYFQTSYTLRGGDFWSEGLLERDFAYTMYGHVDFTRVVPEPSSIVLLAGGSVFSLGVGLTGSRRRKA